MKIKEINTYFVRPRWGFVEIITDQGLSGWGEAVLEGHAGTVLACVHEMEDYLIGADRPILRISGPSCTGPAFTGEEA